MAEVINWGVLGSATIARVCVIPAIQKAANGRLVALASRSPDTAGHLAAEFMIPRAYNSYDELLADPEIDAVYIPLPNHLHLPWTLKALQAGKHVLCEKPLALNAVEARQMAEAATQAGRLLMEAIMYRFHPRSQAIKALVSSGTLGEPRLLHAAFTFTLADDGPHNSRLWPEMGGGALLDVGCYGVSVARWLFDKEPTQVQAQSFYGPTDVDLTTVGMLQFEGGGFATIEASFRSALQQTFSLVGSQGAVELPHNAFIPWEEAAGYYRRGIEDDMPTVVAVPGADEYQLMVEHFAGALVGEHPPAVTLEDSIRNMAVLDALAHAARSNSAVRVDTRNH
jgi:xylose dehydrogenase (NAD/NADP)